MGGFKYDSGGYPARGMFAHGSVFNEHHQPQPQPNSDSFVIFKSGIKPGETVEISVTGNDDQWYSGSAFAPSHFIFVGSADLWILQKSNSGGIGVVGSDTPCDTYRPSCPNGVNWPAFSCLGCRQLLLFVENRGKSDGDFVARMAGSFSNGSI
jgi:hypothetical protein